MNVAVKQVLRPVGDPAKTFADDVVAGLLAEPKHLSPKYFYDERGSQLFEEITQLPEYYPTRTETAILRGERAGDRQAASPTMRRIVEFGAGSSAKARILLREARRVAAYVPVDISAEFLSTEAMSCARTCRTSCCIRSRRILPSHSRCPRASARSRGSASSRARPSAISSRTRPHAFLRACGDAARPRRGAHHRRRSRQGPPRSSTPPTTTPPASPPRSTSTCWSG